LLYYNPIDLLTEGGTMGLSRSAPVSVDLVRVLELLRTHITAALCQTVFTTLRITERQRRWTLQALVEF
jgi:hypothetical protein